MAHIVVHVLWHYSTVASDISLDTRINGFRRPSRSHRIDPFIHESVHQPARANFTFSKSHEGSLITTIVSLAVLLTATNAMPEFASRVPNGANVTGVEALGHADSSGASQKLNAFGAAFNSAMKWTTGLCQADSVGDGQTNGQELGDPNCVWTSGGTPKFTTGVSHPGDATSMADAAVLASNTCAVSSTTASTAPTATSSGGPTSSLGGVCPAVVVAAMGATATVWIHE